MRVYTCACAIVCLWRRAWRGRGKGLLGLGEYANAQALVHNHNVKRLGDQQHTITHTKHIVSQFYFFLYSVMVLFFNFV